jgi:uncharacterized protein (TIGR02594 family)
MKLIRYLWSWVLYFTTVREDKPAPIAASEPKWLTIMRGLEGQREIKGPKHNPVIVGFWAKIGHPEVRDDETAWCAAGVGACLEDAGMASTKAPNARSYLNWGKAHAKPKHGCIVVLKRGTGWQGHVGFYLGRGEKDIRVLGCNQSDMVKVSTFREDDVLGYRWPVTFRNSRTFKAGGAGVFLAASTLAAPAAISWLDYLGAAKPALEWLGGNAWVLDLAPWIKPAIGLLLIMCFVHMMAARKSDLETKGR